MRARTTRDRILGASLTLFNAAGAASVSTNHIAVELDISPGNLYYHFRNKADLVSALYEQFEGEWTPLLFRGDEQGALDIEELWFYLHISFELVSKYRFLFRDTDYLAGKVPNYRGRYRKLLLGKRQSIATILGNLAANGILVASVNELDTIATNMLMIVTYWVSFRQAIATGTQGEDDRAEFTRGVFQVIAILVPYLAQGYRDELQALGDSYK